jgi:hypothetical protein
MEVPKRSLVGRCPDSTRALIAVSVYSRYLPTGRWAAVVSLFSLDSPSDLTKIHLNADDPESECH